MRNYCTVTHQKLTFLHSCYLPAALQYGNWLRTGIITNCVIAIITSAHSNYTEINYTENRSSMFSGDFDSRLRNFVMSLEISFCSMVLSDMEKILRKIVIRKLSNNYLSWQHLFCVSEKLSCSFLKCSREQYELFCHTEMRMILHSDLSWYGNFW